MQSINSTRIHAFVAGAVGIMLLLGAVAQAADLKVMGALGTRAVLEDLGPKFERASGHKLVITFDGVTAIVKRVQAGEMADVVMIARPAIEGFVTDGKVSAQDVTVFARAGTGLAIRKGSPKPDISSSEALKRALLSAKSISCPDPKLGGATGLHFAKVLDRLGIREEMMAKTLFPTPAGGAAIAGMVARGEAELGAHLIQELLEDPGIEIVGPLPGDLQNIIVIAAAIMASATDIDAAKALVAFLRTPAAAAVIKAKGMEASSNAAELKIFTSRAIGTVLDKVGPEFERTTGHKLIVTVGLSTNFVEQIKAGEPFDVVVSPPRTIDELIEGNKVSADTRINLVQSVVGVGVRTGAPKPDISTVEAFKAALLNAKSIGYRPGGVSQLMDHLGITEAIKSKVIMPASDIASELVAKGELELVVVAVTQILTTPGVDLVGPLPQEIRFYTPFAAAVSSESKAPDAAKDLINFLLGATALPVIKSQGLEIIE